jgi:putative oxidoreductase
MLKALIETEAGWWTLFIRIPLGAIFIGHGALKLFGWFGGRGLEATAQLFATSLGLEPALPLAALASGGEFFGGILVLVGLLTRFGALNIAVVMLVAMLKVHWGAFFLPGGIEYTLALLGMALSLLVAGGGRVSIDAEIQKAWYRPRRRRSR